MPHIHPPEVLTPLTYQQICWTFKCTVTNHPIFCAFSVMWKKAAGKGNYPICYQVPASKQLDDFCNLTLNTFTKLFWAIFILSHTVPEYSLVHMRPSSEFFKYPIYNFTNFVQIWSGKLPPKIIRQFRFPAKLIHNKDHFIQNHL